MALNGTREGLFNACMALCPETKGGKQPVVLMPNPFYQVYAVAALAVGAEPVYVPATEATGDLPDYARCPADTLERTAIAYICSPANPQGAVADEAYWAKLIALAERHDFQIFADECYSEIYRDTPPPGALKAAEVRRGSRTRGDFPFIVEALEHAGSQVRFRGGRPREHRAHEAASQLCRCAPSPAAAGGGGARLERRDPCRGKPRALSGEVPHRRRE
jgi:hypothetical protein